MANALKETVVEKIMVADQYENETTEHKGINYWVIIVARKEVILRTALLDICTRRPQ